ncbi:MAG: type 1 glutamine amidotransferase [Pseudomonadales bacterium]
MSKILVLQNDVLSDIAYFGEVLEEHGAELEVLQVHAGERLAVEAALACDALVVLGGRGRCFDDESFPHLPYVVDIIQRFHRAEKGIFGICLGAQLLARALGTAPRAAHGWELGFTPLTSCPSAADDPIFKEIPDTTELYQFHHDSFYLPEGAAHLMRSEQCPNQAFRAGRCSYAVQFHPEITAETIRRWGEAVPQIDPDADDDFIAQIVTYSPAQLDAQQQLCRHLAEHWLCEVEAISSVS